MTVAVANTGNNTWLYLRTRLNELADAMSTKAVTTNSNTAVGNAAISGTFTANVLVANTLTIAGGGSITVANLTANSIAVGVGAFTNVSTNALVSNVATITSLTVTTANVANLIANAFTVGTLALTSLTGNAATFNYLTSNTLGTFANIVATNIRTSGLSVGNSTVNTAIVAANATATSNGNFYLNANGSWNYIPPAAAIPGSNTYVYYNDSGAAGASAGLVFNKTSNTLTVANAIATPMLASNAMLMQSAQVLLAGTSQQVVDSVPLATFRGAEYTFTVKDNNANNFAMGKVMALHNGANAAGQAVEYATLISNTAMGTWDATSNDTHLALLYTPVSSSATVTFNKTSLVV